MLSKLLLSKSIGRGLARGSRRCTTGGNFMLYKSGLVQELGNSFDHSFYREFHVKNPPQMGKLLRRPEMNRTNYCFSSLAHSSTMNIVTSQFPPIDLPTQPFCEIIFDALKHQIAAGSNKVAFYDPAGNVQATFEQVYGASLATSTFLYKNGFKKGDIAMAILPNCWPYIPIFLGVQKAGGAVSGASPLATEAELTRQMKESKSTVVFTYEDFLPKVQKAVSDAGCVKTIVVIPKSPESKLPEDVVNFYAVAKTPIDPTIKYPSIDVENDLALLPFSSGTSGASKGVMLTHKNLTSMLCIAKKHDDENFYKQLDPDWNHEKERFLHVLPFFHVFGFGIAMSTLFNRSSAIILPSFDPVTYCTTIQKHKIRMLYVVPPILVFLAKNPITRKFDLSSIESVLCGAAPAGHDISEELLHKYRNIKYITQAYGLTECSVASTQPNLKDGFVTGSVGQLITNMEMRIVDVDTKQDLQTGGHGEILLKGPTIMKGYLNNPEGTAETIVDGWLHTGDIGYVDDSGHLHIVDRLKELIKVQGMQVAPAELEDVLLSNQFILDVAVIGVPHFRTGEAPRAYIVRANDSLTEEDVHDHMRTHVSKHKQLTGGIKFVDEIPKSAAGKILRRVLAEMYEKEKKFL